MYLKFVYSLLLLSAFVLTLLLKNPSRRWRLLVAALAALWVISWLPTAWLITGVLEGPYSKPIAPPPDAQAIVVLSGGAWPPDWRQPFPILLTSSTVRVRHAAWLYANWKQVPVLVCGSHFTLAPQLPPVSELMAELLIGWGVPSEQIWSESAGGSTYEQSVGAAAILRSLGVERIVVVTEAYHMRRALGCFRAQGFEASPAPCGFRSVPEPVRASHLLPGYRAIELNEEALREWAALAVYSLTGKL